MAGFHRVRLFRSNKRRQILNAKTRRKCRHQRQKKPAAWPVAGRRKMQKVSRERCTACSQACSLWFGIVQSICCDCFCFTLEVLVLRILLALVIVWSAVGALRLGQCPSVNMCEHKESSYNMLQHQAGWLEVLDACFSHSSVICRFHGIYINLYIALILLASCCTHIGGPGLSSFVIGICLTAAAIVRALASACTVAIFELAQCWAYQDGCTLIPGWITGQLAGRQLVGRSWPSRTSMFDFACLRIICTSLLLFLG